MQSKKYEEAKTWIYRIEIEYAKNGTIVTVLNNGGYEDKYIYPHNSLMEGVDSQENDILDAVRKTLNQLKGGE